MKVERLTNKEGKVFGYASNDMKLIGKRVRVDGTVTKPGKYQPQFQNVFFGLGEEVEAEVVEGV